MKKVKVIVIGLNDEILDEYVMELNSTTNATFQKRVRHNLLLDGKLIKRDYKTVKVLDVQ